MQPLAERLRPKTLDEYIGQKHLVGPGAILRKMIDAGRISSFILWGPPGVGKTTIAQIIANKLETPFYTLSAVSHPPSPIPLPALCTQIFGKRRFAGTSATCHHHRCHTEGTKN